MFFLNEFYLFCIILIILIYIIIRLSIKNKNFKKEFFKLKQYQEAVEFSNIVSIADLNGNITYVNDKFCESTLYTKEEVLGKSHNILRGENSAETFVGLWDTIKNKKTWQGILKNKRKNGDFYYVNITIKPVLNEKNEIVEYVAIRHEVTELIRKSEELEKVLQEDFLTKEGNRFKLFKDIIKLEKPSLALLDVNRFAEINDFYGAEVGDEVLKRVAQIIKSMAKKNYIIYRIYSDEFAVLANDEKREDFIENIKTICDEFSLNPIRIKEKDIYLQMSFFFSFEDKENLIKTANMIKKYSKTNKDIIIYDRKLEIEKIYEKNIMWSLKLKKAFENDNIVPYYQAIYNVKTEKIEKYEALVRLIDEDGAVISPYYFLDIAKKSKQYSKITKRVISKTFEYFKDKDLGFSINLTINDINNEEVSSFIIEKLEEYNFDSKVVFEIVESEGIEDFNQINAFIEKIKNLNCKIAIDDFGSGYSNFDYLIKLNADYIKIDGSLIKNILTNQNNLEIVITIIDFAKRQGFKTIAEFVSSKEIFEKVKELGVDYAQGYYIHEPSATVKA